MGRVALKYLFVLIFFTGGPLKASPSTTEFLDLDTQIFKRIVDSGVEEPLFVHLKLSLTCKSLKAHMILINIEEYFPDYYARMVHGILNPTSVPRFVIPIGYTFDPLIESLLGETIKFACDKFWTGDKLELFNKCWRPFGFPHFTAIEYGLEQDQEKKSNLRKDALERGDPWLTFTEIPSERATYENAMQSNNPLLLHYTYHLLNERENGQPNNPLAKDIYEKGQSLNHFWYFQERFFQGALEVILRFIHEQLPRHCGWSMRQLLHQYAPINENLDSAKVNFLIIDGLEETFKLRSKAQAIALVRSYILREGKTVEPFHQAAMELIREKKLNPFVLKADLEVFERERQAHYNAYLATRDQQISEIIPSIQLDTIFQPHKH